MMTRRQFAFSAGCFAASAQAQQTMFTAGARIVEISATVHDPSGRSVPGLGRDHFEIFDAGQRRQAEHFETVETGLSLALLLDTTGSMGQALPSLKSAASRLIDCLRADDSVALFSFSDRLTCLQDFTSDFSAAKLAARRIRVEGTTALFDALAGVTLRVSGRKGKKAIITFTDGMDNSSVLTQNAAVKRAARAGLPVYTIALGAALHSKKLVETLEAISGSTGAAAYMAKKPSDVGEAFEDIAGGLVNTYMLSFPMAPGKGEWRPLKVALVGRQFKNLRVRCREGYYAD